MSNLNKQLLKEIENELDAMQANIAYMRAKVKLVDLSSNSRATMRIYATFTGTNSLGYQRGARYLLHVATGTNNSILIQRDNGDGLCEYSNITMFLTNWNDMVNVA